MPFACGTGVYYHATLSASAGASASSTAAADALAAACEYRDVAPAAAHGVARRTASRSALTTLEGVGSGHFSSSRSTQRRMASPFLEIYKKKTF